jgi:hypothetical protein
VILLPLLVSTASGPSTADWLLAWATLGLAVATVAAVLLGIRTTKVDRRRADKARQQDASDADRRLQDQLAHSDEQLRRQQEHSDRQLAEERAAADERLQRQLAHGEQIEQRSEAAAIQVIAFGTGNADTPGYEPVIIVMNHSRYAIRNVEVRLAADGSIIEPSRKQPLADLRGLPEVWTNSAAANIGSVYVGNIAPKAGVQFTFDRLSFETLWASFPIARWDDRWDEYWEYRKDEVFETDRAADWRP